MMSGTPVRPTVLVLAPMPAAPTSAGNRRRLVATCDALQRGGFAVDFAYFEHEDQIYRRFGRQPPTDIAAMVAQFQRTFVIPASTPIPLKTRARHFSIDAWCPDEAVDFVAWYFATHPETCAVVVNYVFLSRCLEAVPEGVQRIIDTHDRFADRQLQYRPFRSEPNFFYTDEAGEAAGLSRADTILAIQRTEAAYFAALVDRDVRLLPPAFPERHGFRTPRRLSRIGFIGHGNDPNLFSISKFAHAWAAVWQPNLPIVVIAGEICASLGALELPGVELIGYVDSVERFYEGVDAVVAPMLMGSGLKIKVAEALSMGRPVIGTRIAFEGFETRHLAHGLDGVAETVAMIRALFDDSDGLATLTTACADLLAGYNATATACEADWLASIPRRAARSLPAAPAGNAEPPRTVDLGPILLTEECSLRSLPPADGENALLVATETVSPADARARGYAPERRRWFARPRVAADAGSRPLSIHDLRDVSVSFAPEWVRDRSLRQGDREALVTAFANVRADWTGQGRVLATTREGLSLVAGVPGFLLTRRSPTAAFVFDAAGKAREVTLTDLAVLSRSPNLAFRTDRSDLTPIPAVWTLVPAGRPASDAPQVSHETGSWPDEPVMLLLLSDDLIGRLTFPAHAANLSMGKDGQH